LGTKNNHMVSNLMNMRNN